ncbi:hypothetical protein FACS1894159_11420 [Bacteroidia bacterium]|nr:hypothetical protein FACS1894159_11420 [Bacteroidia bacterium]
MRENRQEKACNHSAARRRCLLLAAGMLCVLFTFAQKGTKVSGRITDSSGAPITGASVIEKGTTNGVTSDNKGNYTITLTGPNAMLRFSFIGMAEQEMNVNGRTMLDASMEDKNSILDEVVTIGYSTVKKSDLTGSVSSIKSEDMEDRLVLSVEDALRGRVAGVIVSSNEGAPGEALNIRIRGTGSINASNAPLYVVDGIPLEETDINAGGVGTFALGTGATVRCIKVVMP